MKKIIVCCIVFFASIAMAGPSGQQASYQLYQTLVETPSWWTENAAGDPAKCTFIGTDDEHRAGVVFVQYVDFDESAEIVRTDILWWSVSGDVLDIQGNYFVLSHMGQLYRIPPPTGAETVRQTVRPSNW